MQDKKFFGIMGNASNFLKGLILLETSNSEWTQKYLDPNTGKHWLKYMIDRDNGRYFNLMLLTPKPTTEEMIEIIFSSQDFEEVQGAAHRLFYEEEVEKIEFRQVVIQRLSLINFQNLDTKEKERIKTIIYNGQLTERINQRNTTGKKLSEIQKDVQFFNEVANKAEEILKQI